MRQDTRSTPVGLPALARIPEVILGHRPSQIAQALSVLRSGQARSDLRAEPASMRFVVREDDGGGYRWTLVAGDGERIAQSSRFSSYQEAARAARIARAGAGAATIEERPADNPPVDLAARRHMVKERDQREARGWLDERTDENSQETTP